MWLDKYQESTASEYRWTNNMVNVLKHCSNLNDGSFTIFIDYCEGNSVGKSHSLVICKILRLFVNTFAAYEKYSVLDGEYLTQPIHMQLSQKGNIFF